ncbi:carbohydrate-binding module family 21 protein [Polyporus arcularius HHB13444]|uniref:Carbohydrate-binding module family 21 protein n=1 Tax=Polyporus arcularius HHB13444 TaxID=1314778 RepID=A0A5C3NXW0_9APHY|nr:carbohydrate-binding module family 21 protein [Polyporus arcularius HHB13444]
MNTVLNLHAYAAPMDYYTRHSNSAGAPLPRIPRRSSSSRSITLATLSAPSTPPATTIHRIVAAEPPLAGTSAVPTVLVVQPPTPPRVEPPAQDEASSSSSGSESYVQMHPRAKRTRTPKMQAFRSPADSTPTPAVLRSRSASQLEKGVAFPASQSSTEDTSGNETPRASSSPRVDLHIDLDDLKKTLPLAESSASVALTANIRAEGTSNRAFSAPQSLAASIARKKSGEPLKSSLKSRRPVVRGDLSIVTGEALASTKSEPSTPMAKSVHFDARLEHVKLFLAEQKPLAISRQGSPTDTSGTESDFPSAIYGPRQGEEDKVLTMQLTNKPAVANADADLALEDLTLSEDGASLSGRVRVRNLAFQKWVAVRFTVDSWQTTSEVTAKYLDSVPGGVFDRFSFTIRLGDMLARIEEKTLFFALRFNVIGREIWDNNNGENYKVTFAKVARPRSMPTSTSEGSLASLKSKLENVAKGQETVGGFMAQSKRKGSPFTLEASTSLSARYDFAASWKSPWTRSPPSSVTPTKSSHSRNVTYPNALSYFPKRGSKQAAFDDSPPAGRREALTRGSPRIMDHWDNSPVERSAFRATEDLDDTPVPIMSRRRTKNSQRGYFDLGTSPSVRLTPTGSPTRGASPSRDSNERTPEPARAMTHGMWFLERGGSEESTPSVTSNEESSATSSPSGSPTEDLPFGFGEVRSPSESDSYSSFLNKYCYYTGASDSFLDLPADAIQRSHSASSVEEFLSTSPSPTYLLSPGETPTRSSSYDDVVSIGSGTTTPTARSMSFGMSSPQLLSAA